MASLTRRRLPIVLIALLAAAVLLSSAMLWQQSRRPVGIGAGRPPTLPPPATATSDRAAASGAVSPAGTPTRAGRATPITSHADATAPRAAGRIVPAQPPCRPQDVATATVSGNGSVPTIAGAALPAASTANPTATSGPHDVPTAIAAVPSATTAGSTPDIPILLEIPRAGVSAQVEPVGVTGGDMAAPSTWWDVGWLSINPRPGQVGNAVIDGHLDSPSGAAVFWRLSSLQAGDQVVVTTAAGQKLQFDVVDIESYAVADIPLDTVFGPASTPQLNLITCAGTWDTAKQAYDRRLVVYTRLEST